MTSKTPILDAVVQAVSVDEACCAALAAYERANPKTLYVSVRKMKLGRGGQVAGLWGQYDDLYWDDVPFDAPDKSDASFEAARKSVKRQISESTGIPYRQLRCIGVF